MERPFRRGPTADEQGMTLGDGTKRTGRARATAARPSRRAVTSVAVAVVALLAAVVATPAASAQAPECTGNVDASLTSAELPGGTWSVTGGCLTPDLFYEYREGEAHAQAAIAQVTYDDCHVGRVAVGTLTFGDGIALGVVGVEDQATGLVKWSAVLAPLESSGAASSVQGEGVTLFPTDPATVALTITGTGTDARTLMTTTTTTPETTVPESTTPAPIDTSTTVPATTTPAPAPTTIPGDGSDTTTSSAPPTTVAGASTPTTASP